jgi:sec-independent protein translocase protein TatB
MGAAGLAPDAFERHAKTRTSWYVSRVFGLSFGELLVVAVVGLVVLGPKELPKMLRKAGQWAGRLRRMAIDLRAQSGIDDILRAEGISDDLREITKLARGELNDVVSSARVDTSAYSPGALLGSAAAGASTSTGHAGHDPYHPPSDATVVTRNGAHEYGVSEVLRERENPMQGPDCYNAMPETAVVYAELLPASVWATDPTYTAGIATPPDPTVPPELLHAPDDEPPLPEAAEAPVAEAIVAAAPQPTVPDAVAEPEVPPPAPSADPFSVEAFAAESLPAAKVAEAVAPPSDDAPAAPAPAPREETPL